MSIRFFQKIIRKFNKLRFAPIEVFVFHQVSAEFDASTMWRCDWTQTDKFKSGISTLMRQYSFISLTEAYGHLKNDKFRRKKYAVLTADDGWASLLNIIPWLAEQEIPITLFLNPCYLDSEHFQERETEKLLTKEDVLRLVKQNKQYVSVASHGWIHKDARKMTDVEFFDSISKSENYLADFPNKVPFYAFPFGSWLPEHLPILKSMNLIPVYVNGQPNINDDESINRVCIDDRFINRYK